MTEVNGGDAQPRLRFGIVLDGSTVDAWKAATLDHLERSGLAELTVVVIVGGNRVGTPARRPQRAARSSLRETMGQAAFRAFATHASRSRALRPFDGVAWNDDVTTVRVSRAPATSPGFPLQEADLEKIRRLGLDFVLWFLPAAPAGGLLEIAGHGVWTFRFGGQERYEGQPAGFWELVAGESVVRAALERATLPGEDALVLREGWFATAPESYARTRDRFYLGAAGWPAHVCREILLGGAVVRRASPVRPVARRAISLRTFGRFLAVVTRARLGKYWHHGMRHDDWNIGVVQAPVASFVAGVPVRDVAWAPVRRGHYAADPFGWSDDRGAQILYEDYSHPHGQASIARRRWSRERGWERPVPALDIGSHLSYPFLIEHEGRRLLLPKSRASGRLALYEADPVDGAWRPLADLGLGGDFADATMHERDGRWWLFAVRSDPLNPATALHLWFADQPEGPWQEHPLNPVVVDVRSARPAGPLFRAGGELYRPAQDCSTGYGDRLAIKRVLTLTTERFDEELVRFLEAERDGPFRHGLHTLTGVGDVTLVDGKRRVWSTAATARAIRRRLPV